MRLERGLSVAAFVCLRVACSWPSEMERAGPAGNPCPEVGERPAVDAPPDTTVLRWYRSADERDQRLGGASCRDVGDPVFRGRPAGSFPAWRVGDSLSVVSWNMELGKGDVTRLLDEELGLDCDGRPARLRGGYPLFVLLLQEARRATPTQAASNTDILVVAERCGLALHYVASSAMGPRDGSSGREDRGNAILSTLPMTTPVAIDLPMEGTRKVAVAATVLLPGEERVRVVSADIDGLSTLARTLTSGNQTRTRQVQGLVDGIKRAEDDGPLTAIALVGGDFGTWYESETAIRVIRGAFGESPTWDGRNTNGSFAKDHIFFRRGSFLTVTVGSYERLEERYGSGHHGRRVILNYLPVRQRP